MKRAHALVGRRAELAMLERSLERAHSGQGGLLGVIGDAGVGKSALIRALDAPRTMGRSTPPPSPIARPFLEGALDFVRRGADPASDAMRVHRGALRVLLPGIGLDASATEMPSPMHVVDGFLALREAASDPPTLFVLEDLHWADDFTLIALEYFADRLAGSTALAVATARESPAADVLCRVHQRHDAVLLSLGPLDRAAVADLAQECLGGPPPATLLDAVAVVGGVALQVEELLFFYEREGWLREDDDGWVFDAPSGVLPPTIRETVDVRLGGLDRASRDIVEAGALLGASFDVSVVSAALRIGEGEAEAGVSVARQAGLLSNDTADGSARFAHDLVHDAVLDNVSTPHRRDLAASLFAALADRGQIADLELAARLALAAGDRDGAATMYARSGQSYLSRGLPADAVERFDEALALVTANAVALPIREDRIQALVLAGDAGRAEAEAAVVYAQLEVVGADAARLDACEVAAARAAANAGRWLDADRLTRAMSSRRTSAAKASLGALIGLELGEAQRAEGLARDVLADKHASAAQRCEALEVLGRLARGRDLDEAAALFAQAVATAEISESHLWAARAAHELATIDQLRSLDVDGLLAARERASRAGAPGLSAAVDFHLAAVFGVRFEPEPALDAARRFLDQSRRLGAKRQEAWAWNLIGQAHAAAGARERAAAAGDEALALAGDDHEIAGVAVGTARGLASLLAEDRDKGLTELRAGVEHLRQLPGRGVLPPWFLFPIVASVYDLEGDGGARARSEAADPSLLVARGALATWHLAEAIAHGRRGDVGAANAEVDIADRAFASVPHFEGYRHVAQRFAGEAAMADGWGDPPRWFAEAERWAGARGLSEMRAACSALARRAGVPQKRRRRGAADVPDALAALGVTSREVDVLLLVSEGLTNAEIAARLYLSPRTIKGYVENLLAKTGAANRTQLGAHAPQR